MLTDEQLQAVHDADIANIVAKVKAGRPLTKEEKRRLEAARRADETPATETAADAPAPRGTGLRWSVNTAATEFEIDRRTLAKQIAGAGIAAGPDGKFSTREICQAIYDDERRERLREIKERADKLEMENAERRGELIDAEVIYKHFEGIYVAFRARVLASSLSNEEKDEILTDLAKLKARDIRVPGEAA
ncbi:MAG: hypothetical protein AB1705_25105 [Verrucomicrobiota bacterium]